MSSQRRFVWLNLHKLSGLTRRAEVRVLVILAISAMLLTSILPAHAAFTGSVHLDSPTSISPAQIYPGDEIEKVAGFINTATPGIWVELYLDKNNNGILDSNEPLLSVDKTEGSGRFEIKHILIPADTAPGTYGLIVRRQDTGLLGSSMGSLVLVSCSRPNCALEGTIYGFLSGQLESKLDTLLAGLPSSTGSILSAISSAQSAITSSIASAVTTLQGSITSSTSTITGAISSAQISITTAISGAVTTLQGSITSAKNDIISTLQGSTPVTLTDLENKLDTLLSRLTATRAGYLDNLVNLDQSISSAVTTLQGSISTSTSSITGAITAAQTAITTAITTSTGTITAAISSSTSTITGAITASQGVITGAISSAQSAIISTLQGGDATATLTSIKADKPIITSTSTTASVTTTTTRTITITSNKAFQVKAVYVKATGNLDTKFTAPDTVRAFVGGDSYDVTFTTQDPSANIKLELLSFLKIGIYPALPASAQLNLKVGIDSTTMGGALTVEAVLETAQGATISVTIA